MIDVSSYCVKPGSVVNLNKMPTCQGGGLNKVSARKKLLLLLKRIDQLQELMYAEGKHALLVVLQGMDAAGKDSTIRNVFGPVNPQGCGVVSFKAPTGEELGHDFLWRVHARTPARGMITVFNRSHYEDVLIARVKKLAPLTQIRKRYAHINAFEKLLHDEGTVMVKFFLHISKDYQKARLQRRLDRVEKQWKFNPQDLAERQRWPQYQKAMELVLRQCATDVAPWYVVPAEKRWFRDLLVAQVLVQTLEGMKMRYPRLGFDPGKMVIE
ncbi:MAG: polyphosphate kinase 2 family protein [Phycisphaeraceae bacterium]|nr:polyphosphate kinase 2 family protein [Phycisphaeraceae bacterium]